MTWPAATYQRPALADYGKALGRWWALLILAVAAVNGAVLGGGPASGVLRGLAMLPAIWLVGPLGWPCVRTYLRFHRRHFGEQERLPHAENWRLPMRVLGIHSLVMIVVMLGSGFETPAEFFPVIVMLILAASGWLLWIFWALEAERRHIRLAAAGLPHSYSVRLLRRIEGRPEAGMLQIDVAFGDW